MKYIAKHQQQMPQETAEQYWALGIHTSTGQLLYARSGRSRAEGDCV